MTRGTPIQRFGAKLVLFALPLVILISSIGAFIAWRNYREQTSQARANLAQLAGAAAANVNRFVLDEFQILNAVGSGSVFADGDRRGIEHDMRLANARARGFTDGLSWIDRQGRLRALSNAPPGALGVSLADRRYVREVLTDGSPYVDTVIGRVRPVPLVVVAVPTRDRAGAVNGVLTGSFRLATLERLAPSLGAGSAEVRVVDRDGNLLIGGSTERLEHVEPGSAYVTMRRAGSGVFDVDLGLVGQPDRLIGFATAGAPGWLVALSRDRAAAFHSARRSLMIELATLAAAALLASLGVLWGARRIRRAQADDERRRLSAERLRDTAARLITATDVETVARTVCAAVREELGIDWCGVVGERRNGAGALTPVVSGDPPGDLGALRLHGDGFDGPTVVDAAALASVDPDGVLGAGTGLIVSALGPAGPSRRFIAAPLAPSRALDDVERSALVAIVEDAIQAFERAELIEREHRARERSDLLATIGAELDAAEGTQARVRLLVELLVPGFADFATVEAEGEDGGIELLAARHRDAALRETLVELRANHRPSRDEPLGIARLLRDGKPQMAESLDGRHFVTIGDTPTAQPLIGRLAPGSYVGVPLRSGERTVAGLLLGRSLDNTRFDRADLAFATSVADRAGVAIDRARLYEQEREVALELQQSLLSEHPDVFWDQVWVATRYRPAQQELQVGGDWYDAIALPGGRLALAVGDVVGHGLAAAAAMGKLASALRAIAVGEGDPSEVIRRLELFATRTGGAWLATLAYVVLDLRTGNLRYCVAGHPPPLVIEPAGWGRFLWDGRSGPLGLGELAPRPCGEASLEPGSTVILYSDGLFERRGELLDVSLERVRAVAEAHADLDANALADAMLGDLLEDAPRSDDAAILVARVEHVGRRLRRAFPAEPGELAGLRDAVRGWLAGCDRLDRDGRSDVLLAVGEAASNAVEHAYLTGAGQVEVDLAEHDAAIEITVRDFGRWRTPPAPGARGLGLDIIMRLMDDLTIDVDEDGTVVRMRLGLGSTAGVA